MKLKFIAYLFLVVQVIIGMTLLVLTDKLKISNNFKTGIIFTSLLLLNLLYVRVFILKTSIKTYWSLRKLYYLPAGVVAGLLLIIIPIAMALGTGNLNADALHIDDLSLSSIFITFLIISWEELWFRSLLLNYCSRYISKFNIALTVGFLFMLIHGLNPKISLLKEGPILFLAGTLLTALYFYYRNIWLPVGLHFGNNFFGTITHTNIDEHSLFGSEGYIYTLLLLVAVVFFLLKLWKTRLEYLD